MKPAKKIALCGMSAAIGSLFLYLVPIAPTSKVALFALASVAVIIPISQKIYGGAVLTMLAISAIGFLSGGFPVFVPYILIFGAHPLINAVLEKTIPGRGKWMAVKLALKIVYFNAMLYLVYSLAYIIELFAVEVDFYLLAVFVTLIFIPYDFVIIALQKRIEYFISRYIK